MSLDAIALFVIVCEVEEFKGQVRPDAMNGCWIELTEMNDVRLETQQMGRVHIL